METEDAPTAQLSWSLDVECPACKEDFDITEQDDESAVARHIFSDKWDALKGWEVCCPKCSHEFTIKEVEY